MKHLPNKLRFWIFVVLGIILTGNPASSQPVSSAVSSNDNHHIFFSKDSGIYMLDSMTVTLSAPENCTIAFTVNGKTPSLDDDSGLSEIEVTLGKSGSDYLIDHRELMSYSDLSFSFLLDDPSLPSASILRAAPVSPEGMIGETDTRVYFIDVNLPRLFPDCLILSIVTDPDNLIDYETGILTPGRIYDEWRQTEEGEMDIHKGNAQMIQSNITQHGKAWERPCLLQIYDGRKSPEVELNAGIRITGGYSRSMNQKSFNIYFRESYGSKYLDYELFPGISLYKSFRLKSGGNNTDWLKFMNAFLSDLVSDRKFSVTLSRKAVLFLNGEYWGPYLLTEKLSGRMLHDHYGVEQDQVILFKEGELEEGDEKDIALFTELTAFGEKDLSNPEVFQEFSRIMDIQSMADYFAARIYFGDNDWTPKKNDVLWRTRDQSFNGGRWQYILYDAEFSSGLYGIEKTAAETDHFRLAYSHFPLFAAAIKNQDFYNIFLDALREIGAVNCATERVEHILGVYVNEWEPLMQDYYKRFGNSQSQWDISIINTIDFFKNRYNNIIPIAESYN